MLGKTMVTKGLKLLGSKELKLLFTLEEERKGIFKTGDAHRILGSTDASVKNVLYRLRKKGRIEEIERGKYLLIPAKAGYEGKWAEMPFVIASKIVDPYYIGFWSALNYWGMTEQVPSMTFVVTTKRKRNLENGSFRFKFITLSKNKFFDMVEEEIGGEKFKVSSREKTIVDCLSYPKYCGGIDEVVKGMWEAQDEIDFTKIVEHSEKIRNNVVIRRLMYILNILEIDSKMNKKVLGDIKGFMWLDPTGPKKALEYSKRFGLIINRTRKELTGWRGY
ncbi:MAG: type IV toxin-antitoxin system AbiEi family antitoxin domain-containing protein [Thaumarchaeota archaeon]|nr:type IV toxin-antitoxin system AbiEi family antitoxin domain-containing protein [Nitrososphaerota archaeon]